MTSVRLIETGFDSVKENIRGIRVIRGPTIEWPQAMTYSFVHSWLVPEWALAHEHSNPHHLCHLWLKIKKK